MTFTLQRTRVNLWTHDIETLPVSVHFCRSMSLLLLSRFFINHCLAALDLGAGIEQPFNCLIVQHRQAVQTMRRSMEWTLWTTWSTVCSSAPHSQTAEEVIPHLYKQEWKRPTPVRGRLRRTQALLGKVIPTGVDGSVGDENVESCGVVRPLRIPLVIRPQ